jgi:Tol biopolymer transport system component
MISTLPLPATRRASAVNDWKRTAMRSGEMALTLVLRRERWRANTDGRWARSLVVLALVTLSTTPAFAANGPSQSIVCSTTQITGVARPLSAPADFVAPVISANGDRIAFRTGPGVGPDRGIYLFDVPSGTLSQLTTGDPSAPPNLALGINHDGTRIAFASSIDTTGENADGNPEIFLLDVSTGTFTQITKTVGSSSITPAMNDDGTRVAFRSTADLTGENPDGSTENFLFDTATAAFTQITRTMPVSNVSQPAISGGGARIVFDSRENLTGMNGDGNDEIFLFDVTAGALVQITRTVGGANVLPAIDGEGTRVTFQSTADLAGGNPDRNAEVFVFDTTSGTFTQITNTVSGASLPRSINASGTLITMISSADLTGENPDGNTEVFLYDATAGTFTQTARTEGALGVGAAIGDIGIRIAFVSTHDLTGHNPEGNSAAFLSACERVNDLLSLQALPETFATTAETTGCPVGFAGKFSFDGRLSSHTSSPALTGLQAQVQTLSNDNVLQNADDGPAGIAATLTVPQDGDYSDGSLDSGEQVDVPFVICLRDLSPFQFLVEMRATLR